MIFSGRTGLKCGLCAQPVSHPATVYRTSGLRRCLFVGSPNAGTGFREGKSGRFFSRVVD